MPAPEPERAERPSALDDQLVVYYGTPVAPGLGVLGRIDRAELPDALGGHAARVDELNGARGAKGAIHLIYGMAQADPGPEGMHVGYLADAVVEEYIALAEEHDFEVILDTQVGRNNLVDEVRRMERFLEHPRVHIAFDPEYAVGPSGVPIATTGVVTGAQVNEIQQIVDGIVREHDLPKKMVVMHQFMDHTLVDGEAIREHENVDFMLNMDAWGDVPSKVNRYEHFMSQSWAFNRGYNVFLNLDDRVSDEQELLNLAPTPDAIFYQ